MPSVGPYGYTSPNLTYDDVSQLVAQLTTLLIDGGDGGRHICRIRITEVRGAHGVEVLPAEPVR